MKKKRRVLEAALQVIYNRLFSRCGQTQEVIKAWNVVVEAARQSLNK